MAINEWNKGSKNKHSTIFNKKYKRNDNVENVTAFVYIYNKGWFSGHEDKYVVSTSRTGGSSPSDRINKPFETRKEALNYARKFMKEN